MTVPDDAHLLSLNRFLEANFPSEQMVYAFDGGRASGKRFPMPGWKMHPTVAITTQQLRIFTRDGEMIAACPLGDIQGMRRTIDGFKFQLTEDREIRLYTGFPVAGRIISDIQSAIDSMNEPRRGESHPAGDSDHAPTPVDPPGRGIKL